MVEHSVRPPQLTVSVVIASYARPWALRRSMEAVSQQTWPAHEIIISLISSDHATVALAAEMMAVWPMLYTVESARPDTAMQERAAMKKATGDIIAFIDDDAVAPTDWLARLMAHYEDPRVGGVGGPDILVWEGVEVRPYTEEVGRFTWYGDASGNHHCVTPNVRQVDFLKGCNMSFRRQAMGTLDPRLAGPYGWEEDLACRVRQRNLHVIFDPAIQVLHFTRSPQAQQELAWTPAFLYGFTRNRTIVVLSHGSITRSFVYLFWSSLLAGRTWGLAGTTRKVLRRRVSLSQAGLLFVAATAGRIAAIRAVIRPTDRHQFGN